MTDAHAGDASRFQITKTELYAPVVTLNTENNKKLSDLLKKGLKRSVYWNEYKSKILRINNVNANQANHTRTILLDASCQGVNTLFVAGFDVSNTGIQRNDRRIYFLPRIDMKD